MEGPIPKDSLFDIKLRDGTASLKIRAAWWGQSGEDDDVIAYRPILDTNPSEPEAPEWRGEGLPPVGTVCEVMHCEKWRRCKIIAHLKQRAGMVAVFTIDIGDGSKMLDAFVAECFRPLRSDEDKAVEEMARIIADGHDVYIGAHEAADRLYHAFRDGKVPGVKLTGGE